MSDMPEEYKISDDDINRAWGNANFGGRDKRQVILETLLQIAGDFSTGHTAMCICQDLGLLGTKSSGRLPSLTKKGKRVMYYWNKHRANRQVPAATVKKEQWQPIETAPANSKILLYCPDSGCPTNKERIELDYAKYGRRIDNISSSMSFHSWATHWMPLPQAPQTEDKT